MKRISLRRIISRVDASGRLSRRVAMLSVLALIFAVPAHSAPTAVNRTLQLSLDGPVDVTFNIHDVGMVSGDPRPIYLRDQTLTPVGTDLPPGLKVERVGNACVRLQWAETTQDPFPSDGAGFSVPFFLIAGDLAESNEGTLTVIQGGDSIPVVTPCEDDPANSDPTTSPIDDVDVIDGNFVIIEPLVLAVNDPNGAVRLTDTACWTTPSLGTVTRLNDEQIRYQPTGGTGPDSFEYCVTDNPLDNTTGVRGTVNINVLSADAPDLMSDTADTQIGVEFDIDVLANDPIGDAGTLIDIGIPVPTAKGGIAVPLAEGECNIAPTANGQGCIRYTPPGPDNDGRVFVGEDNFSYEVSAPNGLTASATVTVNVVAPPDTPMPSDDVQTGVIAGVPVEIDVLANDLDDGGQSGLIIESVTTPGGGTAVITPRPDQTPVITYTADASFTGSDFFFYTISDGDPNTINRIGRVDLVVNAPVALTLLEPFAANATQSSVAGAIDVVCPALGDINAADPNALLPAQIDLLDRCSALIEFADTANSTPGVQSALQQIAGEEVIAQGTTGTSIVNTQIRNISSRLAALRSGMTGISTQGIAMNFDSGSLPVGMLLARRGGGASADQEDALLANSRLGIFINGRLNFGDQDSTANEDGFDFDTLGVTIGADYRFKNSLVLGGAVGYADSEVEFNRNGGDLQTEALTYSLYGTYFTDTVYLDVLAGTGSSDFDTRRIMVFEDNRGGVDTVALGTTDGDQSLVSVNFGYNFERGGWVIAPYVGYDYLNTEVEAYNETEGQGWELAFDKQDVKSAIVTGGLRIAFNKSASFGVFTPHLRVAFQKELEEDVRSVQVRFVNDPTNTEFQFLTAPPDNDFYRVGAGFSMVWKNGLSGFIDYETIQGYSNLTSSTLTAGLRLEIRFN